ncbi:MAG: sigma-54 dependent transcriptional regulator [Desulfobulbaceae bacterium]
MLLRIALAITNGSLEKNLADRLNGSDVHIECFGRSPRPIQRINQSCADVIVISESLLPRPVDSGISMLNNLPENPTTVLLHELDSSHEHAELMAAGADVVLFSGVPLDVLVEAIDATLHSRRQLSQFERGMSRTVQPKLSDFESSSEAMQIFINDVKQVAPSDSTLLILGETGVGKEHLAKAIHAESLRAGGPFIALNTAALPEQLLESELFGHVRGSFTGATRSRRGAFEQAHGGTIFLDEIGEMPLHLQTKLLRVLQDYEVRPVGSDMTIWVDVRVIAATNRDLENEVASGNFRKDLFYRLSVMTLTIPPLRERRDDIAALARRFLNYFRYKIGRDITHITEETLHALYSYDWPGNVRELMNVIERAILISKGREITLQDLPSVFHRGIAIADGRPENIDVIPDTWRNMTLPEVSGEILSQVEKLYLHMVLTETAGRIKTAAKRAGIHQRALYNKMKKYGLRKEDYKVPRG